MTAERRHVAGAGIGLGLLAAFCLSIQDVLIKLLTEDIHIFQVVFLRSIITVGLVTLWVRYGGRRRDWRDLKTSRPFLALLRIVFNLSAWFCYYLALAYLPLTVFTSVGYTMIIFAAVLSGPLLGEASGRWDWLAIIAGMAGVLIIVNPFNESVNLFAVGLLLFGALMWALSNIITRALGSYMTSGGILFYTNLGLLLVGGLSAPFVWQSLPTNDWWFIIGIGVLGLFGQGLGITAYRVARVSTVLPTQYTTLLWATIYSWLIWDQVPDGRLFLGAALIIGGGLLGLAVRRPAG